MAVVVFDMDDTLYDEMTYVQSGFSAVAEFLSNGYGISSEDAIMVMNNELMDNGRGQVFDSVLKHFNIWSKYIVLKCLAVYRTHTPDIRLLDDALECLSLLMPDYPMYLVTDGNKMVQNMKVKALGIEQYMKYCFITHRYGIRHSKPSPYVFHKIADREKVDFNRVMYIGDNPNKDFVGIKKLGFKTIRIMRGSFVNIERPPEYEADYRIHSLRELTPKLISNMIGH